MLAEIEQRLEAEVSVLNGRLHPASDFAAVMASNAAPPGGVNGYLVPSGIVGLPTQANGSLSGVFTQGLRRSFTLVVLLRNVDRHGERALKELDSFADAVLRAVCGWAPTGVVGVFELQRAGVLPTQHRGVLAYQFAFFIPDQLRVTS